MFVADDGRRARWLRVVGVGAAGLCLAYAALVLTSVVGIPLDQRVLPDRQPPARIPAAAGVPMPEPAGSEPTNGPAAIPSPAAAPAPSEAAKARSAVRLDAARASRDTVGSSRTAPRGNGVAPRPAIDATEAGDAGRTTHTTTRTTAPRPVASQPSGSSTSSTPASGTRAQNRRPSTVPGVGVGAGTARRPTEAPGASRSRKP